MENVIILTWILLLLISSAYKGICQTETNRDNQNSSCRKIEKVNKVRLSYLSCHQILWD